MDLQASIRRRFLHRQRIEGGDGGTCGELIVCAKEIVYWVNNWVWTFDPRLPGSKTIPFDTWPVQEQFLKWLSELKTKQEGGLVEKSRDAGVTYLCAAFAVHQWLFVPQSSIGFGSRKLELVDRLGDPDCIFEKIRAILYALPKWMLPAGFDRAKHDNFAKILNPENGASITGEGGDNIGRGGRKGVYFVDEAAYLEHPKSVDKALSGNTNCRIDVSTPNGPGNPFATKRFSGTVPIFTFHYRDDPRKTPEWIAAKKRTIDAVTWAQEFEIDYTASIEGICIPAAWVRAAVNLLPRSDARGPIMAGLDIAEFGKDLNVFFPRQGPHVLEPDEWGDVNTTETAWRARDIAEKRKVSEVCYDAGGLGAGVRGTWDTSEKVLPFNVTPVNFGGSPTDDRWPDGQTSAEKFLNLRAEMWWNLRCRFEKSFEFKEKGVQHPLDEMISIPNHPGLIAELSTALIERTDKGKIKLESKKDMRARGVKSPNYADALALAYQAKDTTWSFGSSAERDSLVSSMPREVSSTYRGGGGSNYEPDAEEDGNLGGFNFGTHEG